MKLKKDRSTAEAEATAPGPSLPNKRWLPRCTQPKKTRKIPDPFSSSDWETIMPFETESILRLEPRRLLAASSTTLDSGVLSVTGTGESDTILVRLSVDRDSVVVVANGVESFFTLSSITAIRLEGGLGNDLLENATALPCTFDGGEGDDRLVGGSGVSHFLVSPGSDEPVSLSSSESIFDFSSLPPAMFEWGSGIAAFIDGTFYGAFLLGFEGTSRRMIATDGDDRFRGIIDPGWHVDTSEGDDDIRLNYSGTRDDPPTTIQAGQGNDLIMWGEPSQSLILCGEGNDSVMGSSLPYEGVDGGPGHDAIIFDLLNFTTSLDYTIPPRVEDITLYISGPLVLHGNELNNCIDVGGDGTTVFGNGGNDTILGDPNFAYGGEGNDTFIAKFPRTARTFSGGPGNDTAEYSQFSGVFLEPVPLSLSLDGIANDGFGLFQESNLLPDIENIIGGPKNDTLIGSAANNRLHSGGGDDLIIGNAGNDTLVGEAGRDTIQGNAGNDNLHGGSGNDRLFGGSGNDTIDGGGGRDLLDGQAGNDLLYARDGLIDTLIGGAGFDRARRDNTSVARDVVDGVEAFV